MKIIKKSRGAVEDGFNSIIELLSDVAEAAKHPAAERLWTPQSAITVPDLLALAAKVVKHRGPRIFGGAEDYASLVSDLTPKEPPAIANKGNGNPFVPYPNAYARYRLSRHLVDAADEITKQEGPKSQEVSQLVAEIRTLQDRVRSKVYVGLSRKWKAQKGGQQFYDYIITLFTHDRTKLSVKQLMPRGWEDSFDHAESVTVRIKPPVSLAAGTRRRHLQGPFSLPRPYLCPGLSVCSPSGSWSSINSIVRKDGYANDFILGSGHGMTDFYTAKSGDSIFRPMSRNGNTVVGSLIPYAVPTYESSYDAPSLSGDFALAEIVPGISGHNTIEHTPHPQAFLKGFGSVSSSAKLYKVGANTGYQTGISHTHGEVITAIDDLGNALILRDQIEIIKDGNAFSGVHDSGGLVFEVIMSECINVGLITSSNVVGGKNGLTFASPIHHIISSESLSLSQAEVLV